MITRYDLAWWNGARIAIVRMDTPDQRFSTNAALAGYVVLPACSQPRLDPARAVSYITGWDVAS